MLLTLENSKLPISMFFLLLFVITANTDIFDLEGIVSIPGKTQATLAEIRSVMLSRH